jgi:hypothetical protein
VLLFLETIHMGVIMSFKPIRLPNGKIIASLSDARVMLKKVGNYRRAEPCWVNAIAEFNNTTVYPARASGAESAPSLDFHGSESP